MLCDIKALQDDKTLTRFWKFVKDPSKIAEMRKQYDDALGLFQVRCISHRWMIRPDPRDSWVQQ
jgi:hypothetical protein